MLFWSSGSRDDHEHKDELFDAYSFGNSLTRASFSDVDPDNEVDAIQNAPDPSFRCCSRGKLTFLNLCM